ncbi:carboxylesterase/lipase family protein [Microbacterium indicum]|uniref:carboxylesterase/lipase family protein n=1 Tax=Microbacterium indicum TaxID=358100 RepID=UPI0003FD4CE0|nr:carboxylesterase family protein [Microbacterium indicum]
MPPEPIARTDAGAVRGAWRGGCAVFLGIPYAEPPTGERAFLAPVPHAAWDGVRDATAPGATPQRGAPGETIIPEPSVPGSSTLNVNVFTPDPSPGAGLPVLVYIHGGAYTSGSIASPWYDGSAFARDGVVTVVLSYRIAFRGFAGVRGPDPHNRAVLDWLLALEWVQRNARAFGGDPQRVTLAGQSAGAGAVLTLLAIPRAQHLFRAAWAMSPTLSLLSADAATRLGDAIAAGAGSENTPAALAALPRGALAASERDHLANRTSIAALRAMLDRGLRIGPVVDGEIIDRPTMAGLRGGIGRDKPLVVGTTDDEFTMALDPFAAVLDWIPSVPLLRLLGLRGRAWLRANRRPTAARLGRYASDMLFRRHVPEIADAHGPATSVYRFAWPSPTMRWALHCLDVPFFFDALGAPGVARVAGAHPPQALADEIHGAAVRFVTTGEAPWDPWPRTRVLGRRSRTVDDGYASVAGLGGA